MFNKTQMLKGILEGCVLKVLANESLYSLEIVMRLKNLGFDELSEGTIYPLLLRLEKEGLFNTRKVETNLGPSRKYYALSELGHQELQNFTRLWKDFKLIIENILESGDDFD